MLFILPSKIYHKFAFSDLNTTKLKIKTIKISNLLIFIIHLLVKILLDISSIKIIFRISIIIVFLQKNNKILSMRFYKTCILK